MEGKEYNTIHLIRIQKIEAHTRIKILTIIGTMEMTMCMCILPNHILKSSDPIYDPQCSLLLSAIHEKNT
jgi:hypothetical protein